MDHRGNAPKQRAVRAARAGSAVLAAYSIAGVALLTLLVLASCELPARRMGSAVRDVLAAAPLCPVPRRPFRSLAFLPVCVILLAFAVSGCASTIPGNGAPPCFPPAFSVAPSGAKPGDRVTVMALDAVCDPRYGGNARIQVTMTDAAGVEVLRATAPMNDAGGFSYGFEVPAGSAAGEAAITAMPYNIDWCDDTGRNNRVAGADAPLERLSCVIPTKPLIVVR